MSKKFRGFLIAFLFVVVALPAAAQMKSMRTVLDKPATSAPATTPATTTPATTQPPPPAPPPLIPADTDNTIDTEGSIDTSPAPISPTVPSLMATEDGDVDLCADFKFGAFPIGHDSNKAKCFWDQRGFEMLKNTQMVSSGGSVAASTEVLSDFVYGWRIAFSTAVASEPDEDEAAEDDDDPAATADGDDESEGDGETEAEQEAATNLLQANGGNLSLSAAYPLFIKAFSQNTGGFAVTTFGRVGGTFAAFGDNGSMNSQRFDWNELNANAEWALTTLTKLATIGNRFNFELYTNTGVIAGTKPFRTAVGVKAGEKSAFLHGEIGATVRLGEAMTIGVSYNKYTADGLEGGATLSVGFNRPTPKTPAQP